MRKISVSLLEISSHLNSERSSRVFQSPFKHKGKMYKKIRLRDIIFKEKRCINKKKKARDFFFSISPCNIFLKDNRFGSDLFAYVFVHFAFIFILLIHTAAALSCAAQECVRVTAGVPMQQMNILIRRPLR